MKTHRRFIAPICAALFWTFIVGPFLFPAIRAFAESITAVFPYGLNNFVEGDTIEEEDWNAIEAEIGTRTGNQATGTRDTLNFLVRNALVASSSLEIGTTATNTIHSTATSTFQKGIKIAGGALDITGTATSTFANGITLSGGCFSANGSCIAGTVTGTGVADKVAFWSSSSGLSSDTNFHFDSTNIRLGVGTSSPYAKLSVVGEAVASHFTATTTTATSSLPLLSVSSAFALGSDYVTDITGASLSITTGVLNTIQNIRTSDSPTFAGLTITGNASMLAAFNSSGALVSSSTPTAAYYLATSSIASIFPYASTTALTVSGTGGLYVGTLTGYLKGTSGAVTAQTVPIPVADGGTGAATLTGCLTGNGTGAITGSGTCVITTRALTIAGTANQITSSAGAQDLSADRTWTLSLPSLVVFPGNASSTQLTTTGSTYLATASGNVGIGTTSPFAPLSVAGQMAADYTTTVSTTASSTFAGPVRANSVTGLLFGGAGNALGSLGSNVGYPAFFGNAYRGASTVAISGGSQYMLEFPNDGGLARIATDNAASSNAVISWNTILEFGTDDTIGANYLRIVNAAASANPTISAQGSDADVGIGFATKGSGSSVFSSGNVGVASTSPWGLFAVEQGAETNSFVVSNTGSSTPSFLVRGVNGNGTIGVGTTSPLSSFTVCDTCSLAIPYAADPSVARVGELAINTTSASSSIRFRDGTSERAIYDTVEKTFTIASTTALNGTTTIPLGFSTRGETWERIVCDVDQRAADVDFGDGTNYMTMMKLTSTANNTVPSSNNTFTLYEAREARIGSTTPLWNYLTCTVLVRNNAD